jgi:hypothetical protein
MRALNQYLEQKNRWGVIFGNKPLTMPEDLIKILNMIDCDMSPENLTCDGEASIQSIRKQKAFLEQVRKDIEDNWETTI